MASSRRAALDASRADERAKKASLLDMIAQRRSQQQGAGPRGILGLEDSSEDEGGSGSGRGTAPPPRARAAQPAVLLDSDSSSDDEGENRASNSSSGGSSGSASGGGSAAAPAAKPLGRLVRKADLEAAVCGGGHRSDSTAGDDLAEQLGGLSIQRPSKPAPTFVPGRLPAVHVSRKPAVVESGSEGEDAGCLTLGSRSQFKLSAPVSKKLYPHQVDGVKWLWRLQEAGTGGILADDMGLGKTMQCSAFLAGLLESKLIKRAMVVAPKTLLAHWARELGVCGVGRMTHEYFGSENERQRCLDRVLRHRGVLLTTYGMVLHNSASLAEAEGHDPDEGPLWDLMILDEGHKIKNPRMQLRKHLDAIPVRCRVIISGTPIQNNLAEMHALFDFACPGLLGDARTFKDLYEKRIAIGTDKHATQGERERGAVAAAQLRQTIAPYFLRREKKDVFSTNDSAAGASTGAGEGPEGDAAGAGAGGAPKPQSMGRKNDFIVWLRLKPMQCKVYEAFLNSDAVKAVFNQTNSALSALTVLKKICDHPALLSKRAERGIVSGANRARRQQLAGESSGSEIEEGSASSGEEYYSSDGEGGGRGRGRGGAVGSKKKGKVKARPPQPTLVAEAGGDQWWDWANEGASTQLLDEVHTTGFEASCKTVFVMALLHNLVGEGHRTLIFSQSRVMLNILEAAIKEEGWRFCRIDGSVASAQERELRVKQFQTTDSIPIFLLTSQVGGLGLTLTAADRVIIVDPAWNPSMDNQAVDRAYRIGQSRDVVVYRLISCGTVEEKIYRKQVYKGGLSRTGTEDGEQFRYFSQQELRDLFRLDPGEAERSATQQALHDMHAGQRRASPALQAHLRFLERLEGFAGVSDHDLLYSKKEVEGTGAAPFGSQPPAAAPGQGLVFGGADAGASGSQRSQGGAKPGSPIKRAANQGWSGAGDISDMFNRALSLGGGGGGGGSSAATAVAPGKGAAPPPFGLPTTLQAGRAPAKSPEQARAEELEARLRSQRQLLATPLLLASLPDGGARIRAHVAELERALAALQQGGGAGGSEGGSGMNGDAPGSSSSRGASNEPAKPQPAAGAAAAPSIAAGGWGSRALPQPPAGPAAGIAPVISPVAAAPAVPRQQQQQRATDTAEEDAPARAAAVTGPAAPPAPAAAAPVSPLRAFGSKLLGMATAALGSGQAKALPPPARPSEPAPGKEEAGDIIDLSQDQDDGEGPSPPPPPPLPPAGAPKPKPAPAMPVAAAELEPRRTAPGGSTGGPSSCSEAAGEAEAARQAHHALKQRLLKYATRLRKAQEQGLDTEEEEKLRRKVERLQAEYQAGKRRLKLLEAAQLSLPADS